MENRPKIQKTHLGIGGPKSYGAQFWGRPGGMCGASGGLGDSKSAAHLGGTKRVRPDCVDSQFFRFLICLTPKPPTGTAHSAGPTSDRRPESILAFQAIIFLIFCRLFPPQIFLKIRANFSSLQTQPKNSQSRSLGLPSLLQVAKMTGFS